LQLKNNKEYGDGLYDFLALVRTDQEKTGYTFLDDIDYFVEENTLDDVCLSPEPDGNLGKPTFEDNFEDGNIQKGSSSDWGGWSNGAAEQPEQDNSGWNVPSTVEDASDDWGGWGTEKPNEKKLISGEPVELDTWSDKGAKVESSGGDGSWEKQSSSHGESKKNVDQDSWEKMQASPSENTWDNRKDDGGDGGWEKQTGSCKEQEMKMNKDSWGNKTASLSTNSWDKRKSDASHGDWEKPHDTYNKQSLNVHQDIRGNAWGAKKSDVDDQWEKQLSNYKRKRTNADDGSWGNMMAPPSRNAWVAGEGDGSSNTKSDAWSSWGNNQRSPDDIKKDMVETDERSWEKPDAPHDMVDTWGNSSARNNNVQDDSWDRMTAKDTNTQQDSWDSWDRMTAKDTNTQQDSWDNVAIQNNDLHNDCWDHVAVKATSGAQDSWGNSTPLNNLQNAALVSQGTTNSDVKQSDSWDVWNATSAEDSSSAAKWNEANNSGNSKGWKSDGWGAKTGNWRCDRNNPGRPPRKPDGPLPMPRQRFELTTEEKNILLEVEPIVLRVRRIFREAW
jgi:DNA-directed RNA polymerase V subunit 1